MSLRVSKLPRQARCGIAYCFKYTLINCKKHEYYLHLLYEYEPVLDNSFKILQLKKEFKRIPTKFCMPLLKGLQARMESLFQMTFI